jgi:hypothetical protein
MRWCATASRRLRPGDRRRSARPAGYIIQPDGREEIAAALASCSGFALYVES